MHDTPAKVIADGKSVIFYHDSGLSCFLVGELSVGVGQVLL